jgi:hypothetical protein
MGLVGVYAVHHAGATLTRAANSKVLQGAVEYWTPRPAPAAAPAVAAH